MLTHFKKNCEFYTMYNYARMVQKTVRVVFLLHEHILNYTNIFYNV